VRRGDLSAFADDLLLFLASVSEAKTIVKDLVSLESDWKIFLNIKKSVVLTQLKEDEIAGIPCKQSTKYLGMRISTQKHLTIAYARADICRHVKHFRYRLRNCNGDVKEHLISAYGCSLLRYLGVPL
jgi:hypothetical protein